MSLMSLTTEKSEQLYPKEYRANLEWRHRMLQRCETDPAYQAKVRALYHKDIVFAFNAFFFTLDVRRRPRHHQPFCTYPYQDDFLIGLSDAIEEGRDYPVEKSRDMGVSWMVLGAFFWFWMKPQGGYDFLCGSRIEDYVDKKGDMRALFPKLRYLLYRHPPWLRPKRFNPRKHDTYMKLVNPETGSSITGESNNANFSTGGRYAAILYDEFAKWETTDKSAWTAGGDATPCRIPVSTPFGAAGQFYELVSDEGREKARLHWSLHPRKAEGAYCIWPMPKELTYLQGTEANERVWRSLWYDKECERRKPTEVAQELDIDYLGAGNPVFTGAAALRIRVLRTIRREPLHSFDIELATLALKESTPRDPEGYFRVFREPQGNSLYALGVDVVEGREEGDYAVIKVLNRVTKDVDATYYSRLDEAGLASIVTAIAQYYKTYEPPWVGIETIGPGLSTFDLCWEKYELDNLFMMPTYDSARETVFYKKGFRTNQSSRQVLVSGVNQWLTNGAGWCDARLLKEMGTFVRNKQGKPIAKEGEHDDEVFAFGIALQVDRVAPYSAKATERPVREDNLPEGTFHPSLESLRIPEEPTSVEERCLAQTLLRQREQMEYLKDSNNESFEMGLISFYGG